MSAKTLMVQGTASNVGKSILVTALCRIMRQEGWDVAPFKAQNMSLNSFVTRDGGEMGRAQVVQAEAACVEPTVEMNPILLKPEADNRSQVVVRGKPLQTHSAREYYSQKKHLWGVVTESLDSLLAKYELVIIEGAGSPAEINLRDNDIVNMEVALYARSPVLLVADIDRGGAFASLVGTLELLTPSERSLVKGMVMNKFRGDVSLLTPGLQWLETRTGIPVIGVIPYYHDIRIAEEDSVPLELKTRPNKTDSSLLDIAVILLPHVSNFDDFDPLEQENGVRLRYVRTRHDLGTPDLIFLPGTKSTVADLTYLKQTGIAQDVVGLVSKGVPVIGICGGYQMLGELILDPDHIESDETTVAGLGLLPVTTSFLPIKSTHQVKGHIQGHSGLLGGAYGLPFSGYEIHMGRTTVNTDAPLVIEERSMMACREVEGFTDANGMILGTYIHGLFHNRDVRRSILCQIAARKGIRLNLDDVLPVKDEEYDKLADWVRNNIDMNFINRIVGGKSLK